jgi:hypothetical protein
MIYSATERKKGRPGAKHFRTEVKHVRQKGYTMIVAIGEFLDFPILNARNIDIIITIKPGTNKILKIQITDDTASGFQDLTEDNDKNPFNFGYSSSSHDNDESISEFGAGLKEAFIALSDKITIYTKSGDEYFKIVFDIEKMSKIEDVNESFNYDEKLITQQDYEEEHKLQCGSSIILEEMVDGIIIDIDELKKSIINTYGKIIKKKNIVVKLNGEQLIANNISPFDDIYCKPFNSTTKLYAKKNDRNNEEFYMEVTTANETKYRVFNKEGNKINEKWPIIKTKTELNRLKSLKNVYPECLLDGNQTIELMTLIGTETQFCKKKLLPMGEVLLYKRGRQHGSYLCKSSNGACNAVYLEIEIYSKKVGKELGMTVNKLLKLDKENELCNVVKEVINFLQNNHAYDSSTTIAEKKYNIIKDTDLDITHIDPPTKYKKKIEEEKLEKERLEQERLKAESKRVEQERLDQERLDQERLDQERLDQERMDQERMDQERMEQERMDQERLEQERLEQERLEQERLQQERLEHERLEYERLEYERLEYERLEYERLEYERLEYERLEYERLEYERLEQEKLQQEKLQQEKLQQEKLQQEKLQQEKKEAEQQQSQRVIRYCKGNLKAEKFKEVINIYMNQYDPNQYVSDDDRAYYNKICAKLDIPP